jgi:hypothetical protein
MTDQFKKIHPGAMSGMTGPLGGRGSKASPPRKRTRPQKERRKKPRPTKTAKPESSMKTEKKEKVTTVSPKKLNKIADKIEVEEAGYLPKVNLQTKRDAKRIEREDTNRRRRQNKELKASNRNTEVLSRHQQESTQSRSNSIKSISGNVKSSRNDIVEFNRQVKNPKNSPEILENKAKNARILKKLKAKREKERQKKKTIWNRR